MKIIKIDRVEDSCDQHYDITTEKNHNFFANGMLTHNCNLPARNVVIVGVHRGLNEVDELDIIQMAGRAGRYGIDDAGFVHMIIPEGTTSHWKDVFIHPRPVRSVLNNHHILAFHTLAEISNKEISNSRELMAWYSKSLAFHQDINFTMDDAKALLDDLNNMEMVVQREGSGQLIITGLGNVSAWLYYSPYDISSWYTNFNKLFPRTLRVVEPGEPEPRYPEFDDIVLAWAVGDISTNSYGYTPRDCKSETEEFMWKLRNRGIFATDALHFSVGAYKCLQGDDLKRDPFAPQARAIRYDIDRISEALAAIDGQYAKWNRSDVWKTLPMRVKYGIPVEMVPLTLLPGIGGVKAKKLWDAGVRSLSDVAEPSNRGKLMTMFLPVTVTRIVKKAQEILSKEEAA